ncbi:glycoside hydrolase 43 family protein [Asticcacaulis sp. DXS10W]|uniref:Glycoside hydrolase 43 family protein n=1 Tax=Asticcacaulis currens TaxID=2984210 RepID=A0ABT5ICX4_9CAUL|nr:glycoside hydrolase 43 family protein [Asticcacaulis currens]MDC7693700.1 glycoside hydrolase 43 family protein [Asticcacaulis currens]
MLRMYRLAGLLSFAFLCTSPSFGGAAVLAQTRYENPIIPQDYSDPDVTAFGTSYVMTASSFANVPGLPILVSDDLVHWRLVGHALDKLVPEAHFATPRRGGGVWAPSIRYHQGYLTIYYPDPDFGIYMTRAPKPEGPWSKPELILPGKGFIDPTPFWDDDGQGWLVIGLAKSRAGMNNRLLAYPLSGDGTRVQTQAEPVVLVAGFTLPPVKTAVGVLPWTTIEGPKVYKRDGWYYIFAPAGGVKQGWQGVFRSRHFAGPYEARNVLDQGTTDVNGPHQGALVSLKGADGFIHFQDADSFGRVVWLEPVAWKDGWPIIGEDPDGDGTGQPVKHGTVPTASSRASQDQPLHLSGSDRFEGRLSLHWQWNANPADNWIDLTARPGFARLNAVPMPASLYEAGNVLSQKLPGERFAAETCLDFAPVSTGERAGLVVLGRRYAWIGVEKRADGLYLVQVENSEAEAGGSEKIVAALKVEPGPLCLKAEAKAEWQSVPLPEGQGPWLSLTREKHARLTFAYRQSGQAYTPFGVTFLTRPGKWVGAQIGIFASAPTGTPAFTATRNGSADFDYFRVESLP